MGRIKRAENLKEVVVFEISNEVDNKGGTVVRIVYFESDRGVGRPVLEKRSYINTQWGYKKYSHKRLGINGDDWNEIGKKWDEATEAFRKFRDQYGRY